MTRFWLNSRQCFVNNCLIGGQSEVETIEILSQNKINTWSSLFLLLGNMCRYGGWKVNNCLIGGQSEVEIEGFLLKRSVTHRGIFYDLRWYKSSLKVCFLGWIASLVVSRHKYMCARVLNDQRTINKQRNNIQLFVDL